jgi:hypothetical protein
MFLDIDPVLQGPRPRSSFHADESANNVRPLRRRG